MAEGDETVHVSGSLTGVTVNKAELTVTDDETAGVTISKTGVTVAESGTGTYTVKLTQKPSADVTVTPTSASTDVATVSGALTFTAENYSTAQTVTVTGVDNSDLGTGYAGITHSASGGGYDGVAIASVAVTVTDDETAGVTISETGVTVGENGGTGTYTVVLTQEPSADVTVTPASGSTDVATVSGALTFTAENYSTAQTVTVTGVDNNVLGAGSATITHSASGGGYGGVAIASIAVTVTDDETASDGFSLTVSPNSAGEDAAETDVTVTADVDGTALAAAETIALSLGGTATEGTDYANVTPGSITIAKGATSGEVTFKIDPTEDALDEGSGETIVISGANDNLAQNSSATFTITDNDTKGIVLSKSSLSVGENAGTNTYTVKLASQPTGEVTVALASMDTDATVSPASLTFHAESGNNKNKWDAAQTVTVTGVNDNYDNADNKRDLNVTHTASGADYASVTKGLSVTVTDDDSAPTIALQLSQSSVAEDVTTAPEITVTAQLGGTTRFAAQQTVTVEVGASGDGAVEGTDYDNVAQLSITIAADAASGQTKFTLTPTDDTLGEGEEKISVTAEAASPSGVTVSATELKITDDETVSDGFALSVVPASTRENAAATEVTVTATVDEDDLPAAKTITLSLGGTATKDTDYKDVTPGSITIAAGASSGTVKFTIDPTDDDVDEADETIVISGSTTGLTQNSSATFTITDDDSKGITLSQTARTVAEDGGTQTWTVKLASQPTGTVTVALASTDTDAATVSPSSLTFHPESGTNKNKWDAAQTVTVTGVNDAYDNADNKREVDITHKPSGGGYGSGQNTKVDVTVNDDDDAAEIDLSLDVTSVSEEAGSAQTIKVTATIDGGTRFSSAQTVAIAVGGGNSTATSGTDYGAVAGFNISIAKDAASGEATFDITPTSDKLDEGSGETVEVSGTLSGITVNKATLTITDDDSKGIALSQTARTVAENAGTATWTVKIASQPTGTVTVALASTDTDAATVSPSSLTFHPESGTNKNKWDAAQTVTVTGVNDAYDNSGNEREVDITHQPTGGGYGSGQNTKVNVTVNDDDDAAEIDLSLDVTSVSEEAGSAQTIKVTATIDGGTRFSSAQTVAIAVGGGTATSGTDYTAVSGFNITIAKDAASGEASFNITPTDDVLGEGDETVNVSGSLTGVTVNQAVLTIDDNESVSDGFSLTVSPSSAGEDAAETEVTVTATLDEAALTTATTITLSLAGTATKGADYADVTPGSITIAAGSRTGEVKFKIDPTEDAIADGNETVVINGAATGLTQNSAATFTINDNDTASDGFSLTVSPSSAGEDAAETEVTVTATADGANLPAAKTISLTLGGTATKGTDYTDVTPGSITIAAGAKTGEVKFNIDPTEDSLDEANETIVINGSASGLTQNEAATFTINDNDTKGVTISETGVTVGENGGMGTYTVVLTQEPSADVTVTPASGSTDVATVSGALTFTAENYSTAQTVTVTGVDDDIDSNRTATINHTVSGGDYESVSAASVAVTVTDDDTKGITLSKSSVTLGESGSNTSTTYTVVLDSEPTASVTVAVASADDEVAKVHTGSNTPGESLNLTFATSNWNTAQTVTITAQDDDFDNSGDKREVNITHTASGDDYDGVTKSLPVTVNDDDGAAALNLSLSPTSIAEDADEAQTITVTAAITGTTRFTTDQEVTVSVGGDNDTATKGTDYTEVSDFTITIAAGEASGTGTFSITPTSDDVDEDDETVEVSGELSGITVNSANLTITDNDTRSVTLSPTSVTVGESGTTTADYTVVLESEPTADVTVTVASGDDTVAKVHTGSGTPGESLNLTFTSSNWDDPQTVTVTAQDDDFDNADGKREVNINHTPSGGGYGDSEKVALPVTVTDDDEKGVTVAPTALDVIEDGGTADYTVVLASKPTADVTIAVSSSDANAATVDPASITFTAADWSTAQTVTVTGADDAHDNNHVSATISHAVSGGDYQGLEAPSVEMTVLAAEPVGITDPIDLTVSPQTVGEGGGATAVEVTATIDGAAVGDPHTVMVQVGADNDSATPGEDYEVVADMAVEIPANELSGSATFTLTPVDDARDEGLGEVISISGTLTNVTVRGTALNLADDDTRGITISSTNLDVIEDGGTAIYTVVLASEPTADVTIAVTSSNTGAATVSPASITFTASNWGTDQTVTVTGADEAHDNNHTSATISHEVSGGDYQDLEAPSVTVTVLEGEPVGITDPVDLSVSPQVVDEGAGATEVTVTATIDGSAVSTPQSITVHVGGSGDSAEKGKDYAEVGDFALEIPANSLSGSAAFTLAPVDDQVDEGYGETVSITGTLAGVTVRGTSLNLQDNDQTTVKLSLAPDSVAEGIVSNSISVKATVEGSERLASEATVTVSVGKPGDSAVEGEDYEAAGNVQLTIPANGSSGSTTFNFKPIDDDLAEPAETVTVSGTLTESGVAVTDATLTILDDDSVPPPDKPVGLAATAGLEQVRLDWIKMLNFTVTHWEYRWWKDRGKGPGFIPWTVIPESGALTTSYTVAGLENEIGHTFQIRAVNSTGPGEPSDTVQATPERGKLGWPTGLETHTDEKTEWGAVELEFDDGAGTWSGWTTLQEVSVAGGRVRGRTAAVLAAGTVLRFPGARVRGRKGRRDVQRGVGSRGGRNARARPGGCKGVTNGAAFIRRARA